MMLTNNFDAILPAKFTFGAMAISETKESFIVSARKYRPEAWSEVIGQSAITDTLDNAIKQNHLAHAYLFCGPRGVGKTTCARIFAKEINRSKETRGEEDFSFNIFELDAASNNSVEDIRSLTDQVRIPPQVGKYKVYIIDEVHMLSKQAFNAFLKTLEEPPKHAIFILATTEKHKIIPTILSRCQIYDFNRITVEAIVSQLKTIAQQEHITYEEEALHIIAQKADGAMRDALSIFDQLSSFTKNNLTYVEVLKNLHVLDYDYYFKMTSLLAEADFSASLLLLDEILKQGFDGAHFLGGLASHFRDLLVCQHPSTINLLEVGNAVKNRYKEQASSTDVEWLQSALTSVCEAEFKYKNAPNGRLLIEVTLLKLCGFGLEKKNVYPERELIAKVASREKAIQSKAKAQPEEMVTPPAEAPVFSEVKDSVTTSTLQDQPEIESEEKEKELTPPSTHLKNRVRRTTTILLEDETDQGIEAQESLNETADSTSTIAEIIEDGLDAQIKIEPLEAWSTLLENCLSSGKNALYSIMAKQDMASQFNLDTFTVFLNHEVDQEEFSQHSASVLQELRTLTKNTSLQLKTEIKEQTSSRKLFTSQEKYEFMVNKNPNLEQLRRDLDLDFI